MLKFSNPLGLIFTLVNLLRLDQNFVYERMCKTVPQYKEDTMEARRVFFLIIPSYSNFTNSVNLYNTSESEAYKKIVVTFKKNNKNPENKHHSLASIALPHKTETL